MNIIWPVAHPMASHADAREIYFHGTRFQYFFGKREWHIQPRGELSFRGYMNAFPYAKWIQQTRARGLRLNLCASGGYAELMLFAEHRDGRELLSVTPLEPRAQPGWVSVEVPELDTQTVMLSWQIVAESRTVIHDLHLTAAPARKSRVETCIVITTFNRPRELQAAVRALEDLHDLEPAMEILIVNNGGKMPALATRTKLKTLANANLGGSGGFARGLAEILRAGHFTHALFMDDDALCHPVALHRSAQFLRHACSEDSAIGGAMLYSEYPKIQYEQGAAIAPYGVLSINQNLDLGHFPNVIENELAPAPGFGPWWYFLFPLACAEVMPFPFFVRGDDVAFSVQNRFNIVMLSSAAAWQPSFEYKISAATEYLATRSFLTLPLVVQTGIWRCDATLDGFRNQFSMEVFGYRYAIAEGMLNALEDAMAGPAFWRDENNTLARTAKLRMLEKATSAAADLRHPSLTDHNKIGYVFGQIWHRLQRRIPALRRLKFRKAGITHNMWAQPVQAAGRRGMIYAARHSGSRLECRYDRAWEASLLARGRVLTARYAENFVANRAQYEAARALLQGPEAWGEKFMPGEVAA